MKKEDYPLVLEAKHVVEILGVSETTAKKYIKEASLELKKQGKIPLNGVTRRVLIPRDLFFEVYGI